MVHHIPKYDLEDEALHRITHDLFCLIRVMLLEQCGAEVRHEHGGFAFLKRRADSRRFPALAGRIGLRSRSPLGGATAPVWRRAALPAAGAHTAWRPPALAPRRAGLGFIWRRHGCPPWKGLQTR